MGGGHYHHNAKMGVGGREIFLSDLPRYLFLSWAGWGLAHTSRLARSRIALSWAIACHTQKPVGIAFPHPCQHLVPGRAVGQCEMEAVIESKMNNSFGAIAHAPFGLILNPFVLLCPFPQPCFMASLRGQGAMHHHAGEEVGGKAGAGIVGRLGKAFKTLDERAGWILLVLLERK